MRFCVIFRLPGCCGCGHPRAIHSATRFRHHPVNGSANGAPVPAAPTCLDESRDAGEGGSRRLSSEAGRRLEAKVGLNWRISLTENRFLPNRSSALPGNIRRRRRLTRKIKIRTAHEVMAARTAQLALFVDQLMTALRTISPVLAGNVFGRSNANVRPGAFIGVPLRLSHEVENALLWSPEFFLHFAVIHFNQRRAGFQ